MAWVRKIQISKIHSMASESSVPCADGNSDTHSIYAEKITVIWSKFILLLVQMSEIGTSENSLMSGKSYCRTYWAENRYISSRHKRTERRLCIRWKQMIIQFVVNSHAKQMHSFIVPINFEISFQRTLNLENRLFAATQHT